MKVDFRGKWAKGVNLGRWREALTASALMGRDGVGAYLGSEGLTLVQVRQGLSGVQVGHWETYPVTSGPMAELAPALKETVAAWNLASGPVSLAVSPHLGFCRPASLPRAASENLAQVVAYELDRFVPVPADRLFYGFRVVEETATEIRLLVMAVARDRVEECLGLLTEAGLRPVAVELAPVAASRVFTLSGRSLPAWLLLHLEEGAFELTMLAGGQVQAIASGRHLQGRDLSRAVLAQVEAMAAAGPDPRVLGIYGRGGAAFPVGILKKYELETMYAGQLPLPGLLPEMNLSEVLPAVGAGLACFGPAAGGVNLLPPASRAAIRLGRYSFTTMVLLVFLGLSLPLGRQRLSPHPGGTLPGQPADRRVEPGSQRGGKAPEGEPGPGPAAGEPGQDRRIPGQADGPQGVDPADSGEHLAGKLAPQQAAPGLERHVHRRLGPDSPAGQVGVARKKPNLPHP